MNLDQNKKTIMILMTGDTDRKQENERWGKREGKYHKLEVIIKKRQKEQ